MTINGRSQVYASSSGVSDGWQTAFYQFTATGTTASLELAINGLAGIDYNAAYGSSSGGMIIVDSLSSQQIAQLAMTQGAGVQLSTLIGGVTDVDSGAALAGYAITSAAADSSGNHWQYSINNGASWIDIGAVSSSAALFLAPTNLIRWTGPAGSYTALSAVAVDNTSTASFDTGTVGHLDVSHTGGTTPFSGQINLGGSAADVVAGTSGNDVLTGGAGADTFVWHLADRGKATAPAVDTVSDFNNAASGGDILDLRDVLVGELHSGTNVGNLGDYLHFSVTGSGSTAVTSVAVSSVGTVSASSDLTIKLVGVDLTSGVVPANGQTMDQAIIQNLLTHGKLIVD